MSEQEKQLNYFAYASNLDGRQMEERKVPWISKDIALLPNHEVLFNKRGVLYPGYAAANVQPCEGTNTEGVLYVLPDEQALRQLDKFETGYRKEIKHVLIKKDQSTRQAIVYVAKPEFIVSDMKPSPTYIEKILKGGIGVFTEAYLESLKVKARL